MIRQFLLQLWLVGFVLPGSLGHFYGNHVPTLKSHPKVMEPLALITNARWTVKSSTMLRHENTRPSVSSTSPYRRECSDPWTGSGCQTKATLCLGTYDMKTYDRRSKNTIAIRWISENEMDTIGICKLRREREKWYILILKKYTIHRCRYYGKMRDSLKHNANE